MAMGIETNSQRMRYLCCSKGVVGAEVQALLTLAATSDIYQTFDPPLTGGKYN